MKWKLNISQRDFSKASPTCFLLTLRSCQIRVCVYLPIPLMETAAAPDLLVTHQRKSALPPTLLCRLPKRPLHLSAATAVHRPACPPWPLARLPASEMDTCVSAVGYLLASVGMFAKGSIAFAACGGAGSSITDSGAIALPPPPCSSLYVGVRELSPKECSQEISASNKRLTEEPGGP